MYRSNLIIIYVFGYSLVSSCARITDRSCETAAVAKILNIQSAEDHFRDQFRRFANQEELETQDSTITTVSCYSGSQYRFVIATNGSGYSVSALPSSIRSDTRRTFYSDQTKILRQSWNPSQPATVTSSELER